MPQKYKPFKNARQLGAFFLALIICSAVAWQSAQISTNSSLENLRENSAHTLNLIVENMRGELSQHRYQPRLLAANPLVKDVLYKNGPWAKIQVLNKELAEINTLTGALDTYLMNKSGLTIAASNWDSEKSFIGKNFNYRPYFKQAISGQAGRYFALGTTSRIRGYYFSHPVKKQDRIVGAAIVKVDVGKLETSWTSLNHEVIVTDQDGVIFLSSRPDWRYKTLKQLDAEDRTRIFEDRRYPDQKLESLNLLEKSRFENGADKLIIQGDTVSEGGQAGGVEEFMRLSSPMPIADWKVHILVKTDFIKTQSIIVMLVTFFIIASILFIITNIYERGRREAETIALQAKINAELERRVKDRTAKLTKANKRLRDEVDVRRKTEKELLQTQEELVQASKLAALGQMSAGLSHELNQPLGAIRSYADNANSYLSIGEKEKAKNNLLGISELTERMARIIKHLRTYARKEKTGVRPTSVNKAILEALGLLQQRIANESVRVKTDFPDHEVMAVGGQVRLQQVFVNLISNALDAVFDSSEKKIDIAVKQKKDIVIIEVRDSGAGIDTGNKSNIFDPFFTTKEVGQGMGLGLSITYGIIKQIGGRIEALNKNGGGAIFRINLQAVNEMEAETL